jgi:hypothetical protein
MKQQKKAVIDIDNTLCVERLGSDACLSIELDHGMI